MNETAHIEDGIIREYELAFIALDEAETSQLFDILKKNTTTLTHQSEVTSVTLAYPIDKHTSGFFGFCRFMAHPEIIEKIHNEIAIVPQILRFLIISPPIKDPVRMEKRPMTPSPVTAPTLPKTETTSGTVLSNEDLEQKLEEILK